ncbi:MAG TPA: YraN family protein [Chloroflexota bacterium]|nr:YraN family protein [Chloroflexota bacterium]
MTVGRLGIGRLGERAAVAYLQSRGYRILATNWRTRFGEIDVVAEQGGTLVFVEVRTRRTGGFGTAAESVDGRKQRQLVLMAQQYLQRHAPTAPARIDVITVSASPRAPAAVEHFIGAVSAD